MKCSSSISFPCIFIKCSSISFFLFIFSSVVAAASTTAVNVKCFDTITSDTNLTANVICDCASNQAALTVDGATLNLAGYTVSCEYTTPCCEEDEETFIGIKLIGSNSVVEGPGVVTDSHVGIWLGGFGSHHVEGIEVTNTANDAISINSNNNTVSNCIVLDAGNGPSGDSNGDGIDIGPTASGNLVENNIIIRAADDGIDVDGTDNYILDNQIIDTRYEDSMAIRGARNNIVGNIIERSGVDGDGIDIKCNKNENNNDDCSFGDNHGHIVRDNQILDVQKRGLKIATSDTIVSGNLISGSGKDGIKIYGKDDKNQITGSNCVIMENTIEDNDDDGLLLESMLCTVSENIIKGNGVGIYLEGDDNTLLENIVQENNVGIFLEGRINLLNENNVENNGQNIVDESDGTNEIID